MQLRALLPAIGMPSIPSILALPKVQDLFDRADVRQRSPNEGRLKMNDQQQKQQYSGVRDQEIRAALDQHWAASDANDFETEHRIYHEDAVLEYPQSGERTRGRLNILNQRASQPSKKRFAVRRIIGGGDLWITEFILTYDDKPSYTVSIMEFRDGKVARETQYFADPFTAPAQRAQWVERMT